MSVPSMLAMAVHDTVENNRTWMTKATLQSLSATVDLDKHPLVVVDNGSCQSTHDVYQEWIETDPQGKKALFLFNGDNLGTARAVNRAIQRRYPGQSVCKVDNDMVIHHKDWLDWLDMAIEREPMIGILALKRKDLCETARANPGDWQYAPLFELPHKAGEPWLYLQAASHVMGSVCCYSSRLLDKVGYLYQPDFYGFDDSLMCVRNKKAGFIGGFLLISPFIDHIDPGGTEYQKWKEETALKNFDQFHTLRDEYMSGKRDIYHGPNGE